MAEVNSKGKSGFVSFCFCWGDKHRFMVAPHFAWWAHQSKGICFKFLVIQYINSILYPLKGNNFYCLTKRNYCGTKYILKLFKSENLHSARQLLPQQARQSGQDSQSQRQQRQHGQNSPCIPQALLCSARQSGSLLKKGLFQTFPPVPPPPQSILFLSTPILQGTRDENFAYLFHPRSVNRHYSHDNYSMGKTWA